MTWNRSYVDHVLTPDQRFAAAHLYQDFIDALTAHVRTVARLPAARGSAAELEELEAALQRRRDEPPPEPAPNVPDLYFALQQRIKAETGEQVLAWMRLGLSRNDLDMTVYMLAVRGKLLAVARRLLDLRSLLLDIAERHTRTVIIAHTHHQPAQPITLAHYLAAAASVLGRDHARLDGVLERMDRCPLGAAALAGSSHPLDRHFSALALGFSRPTANTYEAVAAADWQLDVASLGQTLGVGLSRLLHDLLAGATQGWLRLADDMVQGSSIMPQKRNPVPLEHARTRFSRAAGAAQQLAFGSHNIPFSDLNDVGTDAQEALFTVLSALDAGIDLLATSLRGATIDVDYLRRQAAASDTTATELADELVRTAGFGFPEAHQVVATLVGQMAEQGRLLQEATPDDLRGAGGPEMGPAALAEALSVTAFVARRNGYGGPAPEAVAVHLTGLREELVEDDRVVQMLSTRIDTALSGLRAPRKDVEA